MRLWFFADLAERPLYEGNIIQFANTVELPGPPAQLLFEHFKQAVLANMRGAGEVPLLNYDPEEDAQGMDVFESGTGKMYLETFLLDGLAGQANEDPANETVHFIFLGCAYPTAGRRTGIVIRLWGF